MRTTKLMVINTDNTGLAAFATAFGLIAASDFAARFATTMFTLAVSLAFTHFGKRFLNRHWPQQPQRRRTRKAADKTQ